MKHWLLTRLLPAAVAVAILFTSIVFIRDQSHASEHRIEICESHLDTRFVLKEFLRAGKQNFLALAKTEAERDRIRTQAARLNTILNRQHLDCA